MAAKKILAAEIVCKDVVRAALNLYDRIGEFQGVVAFCHLEHESH